MITICFETGETLGLPLDGLANSIFSGPDLHRAIFENFDVSGADFTNSNLKCVF
ncbi:pentapeptide repeat-containing protein [Pseudomonas sp. nanlin1]|uniref:pentapeptide repeat-containing protein n=1 Tax=Pseudomonas sp. nanlin1 TaxID=3040605 RepID=UPI00388E3FF1